MFEFVATLFSEEKRDSNGDDWRNSSSRERVSFDAIKVDGVLYLVRTWGKRDESYDCGESPMNSEMKYGYVRIFAMPESLLSASKDELFDFAEKNEPLYVEEHRDEYPGLSFLENAAKEMLKGLIL